MDDFYGLAGRLIDFYRYQKYKNGDEKYCVKFFLQNEDGHNMVSFPTYKRMANGEPVKNSGFYMLLADKLGLDFDMPYVFNDQVIQKYENDFVYLVESHQALQVKSFCTYYEERFSKMNKSLVMIELRETFRLLSRVCWVNKNQVDEKKIHAIIQTSQSPSFVICLYYLLYVYYHCFEIDAKKECAVLKEAHLVKCDSDLKKYLEALYQEDFVEKENILKNYKESTQIWRRFMYYNVMWNDSNGRLPYEYLEPMKNFYREMERNGLFFTHQEILWLGQLLCRHCFYYGDYDAALMYAKANLKEVSKAAYPSLLILYFIYQKQNQPLEEKWLNRLNADNFPNMTEVNIILEYLTLRLDEHNAGKAEHMIMARLVPFFKTKKNNYFLNYFFYEELKLCTKVTGHQATLKMYYDLFFTAS